MQPSATCVPLLSRSQAEAHWEHFAGPRCLALEAKKAAFSAALGSERKGRHNGVQSEPAPCGLFLWLFLFSKKKEWAKEYGF